MNMRMRLRFQIHRDDEFYRALAKGTSTQNKTNAQTNAQIEVGTQVYERTDRHTGRQKAEAKPKSIAHIRRCERASERAFPRQHTSRPMVSLCVCAFVCLCARLRFQADQLREGKKRQQF